MSTQNPNVTTWVGMLKGGVPVLHVRHQAQHHWVGLKALPDNTEGKAQAMQDVETFIADLDAGKYNAT